MIVPEEHLMALCRVSLAKEQCHNPHHPTIRYISRNWPSELPSLTSSKFCYLLSCADPGQFAEPLVNLPEASQVAWTLRVTSPLRQIYSSPWSPGLNLHMCAVKCTNCAWKCKLILQIIFGSLKVQYSDGFPFPLLHQFGNQSHQHAAKTHPSFAYCLKHRLWSPYFHLRNIYIPTSMIHFHNEIK